MGNVKHIGQEIVLYQPLALDIQEEQEWADKAEVEAFTGLDNPVKTRENPQ